MRRVRTLRSSGRSSQRESTKVFWSAPPVADLPGASRSPISEQRVEALDAGEGVEAEALDADRVLPLLALRLVDLRERVQRQRAPRIELRPPRGAAGDGALEIPRAPRALPEAVARGGVVGRRQRVCLREVGFEGVPRRPRIAVLEEDARDLAEHLRVVRRELVERLHRGVHARVGLGGGGAGSRARWRRIRGGRGRDARAEGPAERLDVTREHPHRLVPRQHLRARDQRLVELRGLEVALRLEREVAQEDEGVGVRGVEVRRLARRLRGLVAVEELVAVEAGGLRVEPRLGELALGVLDLLVDLRDGRRRVAALRVGLAERAGRPRVLRVRLDGRLVPLDGAVQIPAPLEQLAPRAATARPAPRASRPCRRAPRSPSARRRRPR